MVKGVPDVTVPNVPKPNEPAKEVVKKQEFTPHPDEPPQPPNKTYQEIDHDPPKK